ncbi:uncharacterized protein RVIR1_13290 [Candidatus Rickettsiella viridis]|uniref:FHA domain-containing protein n=1 Tax=Candidatus Rickettsiella viridis TaxID=676208 RepID=A0A2Z5UVY5_9COXI|nr:hypothetical protein [Candidatus Rickettsiella viridis]BBB15776.1 uncharacterized protein RVIR1_13290 [Candidatus Rickettsiella viridis]
MRGTAGVITGVFDIVDLGLSIQQLLNAEKGTKQWRDAIAGVTISTVSLASGVVLVVVAAPPGVNIAVALTIITASMVYQGFSTLEEYKAYRLTIDEGFRLFWHSAVSISPPDDIEHLTLQIDKINELAKEYERFLDRLPKEIFAIGFGTGDIVSHKKVTEADTDSTCTPPPACSSRIGNCRKDNRPERCFEKVEWWVSNEPTRATISLHKKFPVLSLLSRMEDIKDKSRYLPSSISSLLLGFPDIEPPIESLYECNNSFVLGNSTRIQQMKRLNDKGVILLDLSLISAGKIQGSPDHDTIFNIYSGNATLVGGYKINRYNLLNATFIGRLEGNVDSVDIVDASGLSGTHQTLFYSDERLRIKEYSDNDITSFRKNPRLFIENYLSIKTKQINKIVGRSGQPDYFDCYGDSAERSEPILFNSLGGTAETPDEISCQRAILSGYTNVQIKDDVFFNVDTKPNYRINFNQTGLINIDIGQRHFPVSLAVDAISLIMQSALYYFFNENYLKIESLIASGQFLTIKLQNYWNTASNASNYIFADEIGSYQINPLLSEPSREEQPLFSSDFVLMGKINTPLFRTNQLVTYFNITSANNTLLSFLELYPDLDGNNALICIGSQEADMIPLLDEKIDFTLGGEGEDIYLARKQQIFPIERKNTTHPLIIINNDSQDKALDLLLLPDTIATIHLTRQNGSLLIKDNSLEKAFLVKDYFVNKNHQHLALQDIYGNLWMPYQENGLVSGIPYYRAVKQKIFTLDAAFIAHYPKIAIESSDLESWIYYHDTRDLLLVDANRQEEGLALRIKDFYTDSLIKLQLSLLAVENGTFITDTMAGNKSIKSHSVNEKAKLAVNQLTVMQLLAEERIEHYVYRFTDLPKLIYSRPSANETSGEQKYVIVQLDDIALHHVNVSVLSNHLQLNLYTTNEKNSHITALYWDNPLHRINELIIDGVDIQGLEKFELTEIQHIEKAIYHALFRELVARQQKKINLSIEMIEDLKFLLILQAQAEKSATVNFYKHLDFATQADLNQFIQIYKNTYRDDATILRRLGQLFAGESGVKQTAYLLWHNSKSQCNGCV